MRLWRNPKDGTAFYLGAELNSLWVFQRADPDKGPTVMNSIMMPIGVDW